MKQTSRTGSEFSDLSSLFVPEFRVESIQILRLRFQSGYICALSCKEKTQQQHYLVSISEENAKTL